MKERLFQVIRIGGIILAAGLLYAGFVFTTGWGIPCVIRTTTGFLCPGCGMTRMCLALLKGDFSAAFHANAGIFLASPILAVCLVSSLVRFIRTGSRQLTRLQNVLLIIVIVWMLGFGIIRNLI